MLDTMKSLIFRTRFWNTFGKNRKETAYWEGNVEKMIRWYRSQEPWRLPFPTEREKETRFDERKNAVMTYIGAETRAATYLSDLCLSADAFRGLKVADIGSGPLPTLLVFEDCERYCIDHLLDTYRKLGYPLQEFENQCHFINAKSEALPHPDSFFDVVLSRNALDHVDDFAASCREILRVLKPGGYLHLLLNQDHAPTSTETQVLTDELVQECLGSVGLRSIYCKEGAWGMVGGRTVLWSNLPDELLNGEQRV